MKHPVYFDLSTCEGFREFQRSLVQLTDDESRDLEEICDYIDRHGARGRANRVLKQMEKAFGTLSDFSGRGNHPRELLDIGILDYREIFFKPFRIITG